MIEDRIPGLSGIMCAHRIPYAVLIKFKSYSANLHGDVVYHMHRSSKAV